MLSSYSDISKIIIDNWNQFGIQLIQVSEDFYNNNNNNTDIDNNNYDNNNNSLTISTYSSSSSMLPSSGDISKNTSMSNIKN
ncbi:Uncharacterized protein CTYZ_00003195 [Cryptosporidium tyzzeri]|nr:Uncharacterized protein CTYZ_00003195 [Cryptosporidium tyzzeri]